MFVAAESEITGNLQTNHFSDLIAEVAQSRLSGSFRLENSEAKANIYFEDGELIYAVSNLRQHRLFEQFLKDGVSREMLTIIPHVTNDLALANAFEKQGIMPKELIAEKMKRQMLEIVSSILDWETGEWVFNYLARAKAEMHHDLNVSQLLFEYTKGLSDDAISNRFKSFSEEFATLKEFSMEFNFLPHEAFIYSRLDFTYQSIEQIRATTGIPTNLVLKTLYSLWLGGLIKRKHWNSAFSDSQISYFLSAKIHKKELIKPVIEAVKAADEQEVPITETIEIEPLPAEISEAKQLETYLKRVEAAESYYEILNVAIKAEVPEIKSAYFSFAKKYHPDLFHHETNLEIQQRVQNAFTEIARAYDTLKDEKLREVYDFKLRKYLDSVTEPSAVRDASNDIEDTTNYSDARTQFEKGFDYIMKDSLEDALPYLSRAVEMAPDNARYHAYYGKALTCDMDQRHKAEAELRTAIKLDPENVSYRIMVAEFYIKFNLLKRAEGELQRTLAQFPGNHDAETLLSSLKAN